MPAPNLDFLKELKNSPGTLGAWLNDLAQLAKRINVIDDVSISDEFLYPVRFNNNTGEVVPPGAILVSDGAATIDGKPGINATKPATLWQFTWYINAMVPIPIDGKGRCSLAVYPILIRTDSAAITPGMRFGPTASSFVSTLNRNGFICSGGEERTIGSDTYVWGIQNFPQTFFGKPTESKLKDATDATINLWNSGFTGATGFHLDDVTIRTRDVEDTDRMSGLLDSNVATAYPIDCEAGT